MTSPRKRILLVAALLSFATLVAAATVGLQGESGAAPEAWTVPFSRVGDAYTYVLFEPAQDGEWQPFGSMVVHVRAPEWSSDREGTTRRTVPLAVTLNETVEGTWRNALVPGVLDEGGTRTWNQSYHYIQYIDPARRAALRTDWGNPGRGLVVSELAPFGAAVALQYQGHDIAATDPNLINPAPGSTFEYWSAEWAHGFNTLGHPAVQVRVGRFAEAPSGLPGDLLEHTSRVVGTSAVDGRQALVVETRTKVRVPDPVPDFFAYDPILAWAGMEVSRVQRDWLAADSPVPLLREDAYYVVDATGERLVDVVRHALQRYEPGGEPTVWHELPARGDDLWPRDRHTHRGQPVADGAGVQLTYPFQEALNDATGPLSPPTVQLWRQTHPGHHLVAARFRAGELSAPEAPTSSWNLVFATPDGAGREVLTERFASGTVRVHDLGDLRVPAFDPKDIPDTTVTLAQASLAHAKLHDVVPTNYFQWGFSVPERPSPACARGHVQPGLGEPGPTSDELRILRAGTTNLGPCWDPSALDPATLQTADVHLRGVAFDTATGDVALLFRFEDRFDVPSAFAWADGKVPEVAAHGGAPASRPAASWPQPRTDAVVVGAAVAGAALLAYFAPVVRLWGLQAMLLLPAYAKLRKSELLDNRVRDGIIQAVQAEPGVTPTELRQRVDAGWGTIVYHLRVLEKNNLVSSLVDGRHRRYFPVGVVDFDERGRIALLRNERTRRILEMVAEEPGIHLRKIASLQGVTSAGARWHLHRLEGAGMVGTVRKHGRVHYFANPETGASSEPPGMEVA